MPQGVIQWGGGVQLHPASYLPLHPLLRPSSPALLRQLKGFHSSSVQPTLAPSPSSCDMAFSVATAGCM